jgi:hypothetical protein
MCASGLCVMYGILGDVYPSKLEFESTDKVACSVWISR